MPRPQGDDLVKVGENMIGEGKAKDAIGVIQNGLKKPLKDANNGQIRLGQAYLAAGQKADAPEAFSKVKAPRRMPWWPISGSWPPAAKRPQLTTRARDESPAPFFFGDIKARRISQNLHLFPCEN